MLIVISPAKTLDYETALPTSQTSDYEFESESQELINILKRKSVDEIKSMMKLSDKLAILNKERYDLWKLPFSNVSARASMFAFKGDVYQGLSAHDLNEKQINFAQDHLRILSGLYGLLKPLDKMLPYRLEMGTRLNNKKGKDLYSFWGNKIAYKLNEDMPSGEEKFLINLASNEYFKSIKTDLLEYDVYTPQFLDEKNGNYKIISFYAKKARGLMAAWIIKNEVTSPDSIRDFDVGGYVYDEERSSEFDPVFIRNEV